MAPTFVSQTSSNCDESEMRANPSAIRRKRRSTLRPRRDKSSKSYRGSTAYQIHDEALGSSECSHGSAIKLDNIKISNPSLNPGPAHGPNDRASATHESHHSANQDTQPLYCKPRGPGDMWFCPYDGCNRKVLEAKKPDSITLIKDHFSTAHAANVETLVNSECEPWVSVDHLVRKIKGIKPIRALPASQGSEFSPHVIRRY